MSPIIDARRSDSRHICGAFCAAEAVHRPLIRLVSLIAGLAFSLAVAAVETTHQPLFDTQNPLALRIEGPFALLDKDRAGKSEYREGTLHLMDPLQGEVSLPIKIRTRGKTRRREDICSMPPLRLRFRSKTTAGTLFENQKSLKLVTHCQDRDPYDQYVLMEYLAYRMYNLLTTYSQRVRLVQVTYQEGTELITTRHGILLEDWKKAAARNHAEPMSINGSADISMLSVPDVNRLSLFQFMIGNEDWSVFKAEPEENCCHNSKPLLTANGSIVPLPYDFDYAGIVNARYAVAKPPNKDVRNRRYQGLCSMQGDLPQAIEIFHQQRQGLYDLIRNQSGLTKRKRKTNLKYLDKFYAVISDPKQVQRRLVERCKPH